MHEDQPIQFLIERNGQAAAITWVRRTLVIYRAAVVGRSHFSSPDGFRRGIVESYCDFKRRLAAVHAYASTHER